ncbi:Nonribosomal peptide synthetase 1 [Fusarium culmorum]|uniref:Nonribosomal peptide synthetase 1 n=1 Tax=Fusarium culmorum TaxID=5516 RepID=A0A2T4GRR7_FUSCU|nr:Nonribosomal peptide synthetase 1 [Fusarium culmorum]
MAPPAAVSPIFVPQIGAPTEFHELEPQWDTVGVECSGLTNKALTNWLHKERHSHLSLIQAAWALCLRGYTGSEDVSFTCLGPERNYCCHVSPTQPVRSLFDLQHVDSIGQNRTTFWDAISVVLTHEDLIEVTDPSAMFDLAVCFSQRVEAHLPSIKVYYRSSKVMSAMAEMIAATVAKSIEEIVAKIDSQINDLELCSDLDINRLARWNILSNAQDPIPQPIHRVISQNSTLHPTSIAVSAWDGDFTYRELDRLATGLAIWLQHLGIVGPEVFVPLVFDKSKWAVVAQLAVLKAGGAYFFINPSHPVQYSRELCSSLNPLVAVCSANHSDIAKELVCEAIALGDSVRELLESIPVDDTPGSPTVDISTSNAMYITFTSGTTGKPKGIITEHSAFYCMAVANAKSLQINNTTRMLQFASYSFDVSNRDTLVTLMFGGRVCIPSESDRLNNLAGFMRDHEVNLASLTPSMASTLSPSSCPSLRGLVLGGEPMTESHISTWSKHVQLFNAYGVSESTGIAALASNIKSGVSPSNIGYGCGSRLWVVAIDQPDKLAPIGALGELVIEGPSISRGYLDDKARTDQHFTSDPTWKKRIYQEYGSRQSGKRTFRTGDLVRYNLDGSLQLAGRRDHQVKVNGQRLELTAVEHHISACPQVLEGGFGHVAVVAVKAGNSGSTKLVAFLGRDTSRETCTPAQMVPEQLKDMDGLRSDLEGFLLLDLPSYMVPSEFVFLQHMPLTTSNKLNRLLLQNTAAQALAADQDEQLNGHDLSDGEAPPTDDERILAETWAKILGIKKSTISRNDSFFRRGGDSMAAIRMVASLREAGFVISVSDIFKTSILSELALLMVQADEKSTSTLPAPFSMLEDSQKTIQSIATESGLLVDDIEDAYPCTHMQQGLLALTAQNSRAYIGTYFWQLASGVDMDRFKQAWQDVWQHNPILRTRAVQTPEGLLQVVVRADMPWELVSSVTGFSTKIDINEGPLARFYLSADTFRLDIHHALFDEWSLDLLLAQVQQAYAGEALQMKPFSPFVRHILQQDHLSSETFWRQQFSGLEVEHFPPTASKVGDTTKTIVLERDLPLDAEMSTKYTISSVVRLAWAILLWHQTGSEDVVFGATVSGRNASIDGIDQISGPTLASLPVRIKLPTGSSVQDGLAEVQDQFVNMIPHEQTGLSRIRQYGKEAAEACNFQNLLVVQPHEQKTNSAVFQSSTGGAASSDNTTAFASYPLVLTCRPDEGKVNFKAAFDSDLINSETIKGLLRQLSHVVRQIMTSESVAIRDISTVPPQDMEKLQVWNETVPKAVDSCVHDRIRDLSKSQPDALAVHSMDLDLTYRQVEDYSNHFASHLISQGVTQGDFVPVLIERSPWAPVIMLAVLKTGAAFVLLDLSHPIQRLRTMCSMIDAKILVAFEQTRHIGEGLSLPITVFEPTTYLGSQDQPSNSVPPTISPRPDSPACVVFSSGSTGVPKGIVLPHGAIATSATVMREHGNLTTTSRVFHFASFAFDISIGEILFTLAAGACICVPHEQERRDNPGKAAGDLKATWALLTPSVINLFDPSDVPTLETLGSCGEPLTSQIVDIWAHKLNLFAMYAPAECTVISHIGRVLPETHPSHIGRSFGAASWVVDPADHNRLVPIGTIGELLVEGPVVSTGYLKDKARSDLVFVDNPSWLSQFRSSCGRMYKTGDLVRQTPDGSLQFLGRKDDQVKLHGQRLEVGEVEHCLMSVCEDIKAVAVERSMGPSRKRGRGGGVQWIASPNEEFYSTIEALDTSARDQLPSYMVPAYFIPVAHIPLSLSGKINRRLLRETFSGSMSKKLDQYQLRTNTAEVDGTPETAHDREIQEIFAKVLNVDAQSVPMNGNFFSMGGDSISAMAASTLARRRGIDLAVATIFTHQVLSKISLACAPVNGEVTEAAEHTEGQNGNVSNGGQIPLNELPSHIPRDVLENVIEASPATEFQAMTLYNFYSRYLWIALPDAVDEERLEAAYNGLVQKHSILRTVFYTNTDGSIIQLTLRDMPVALTHYADVDDMEKHCADDSLAMGVPIDGNVGIQAQLLKLKDSRMILALRLPHALFDGMSLSTICEDLNSAYTGQEMSPCGQFSDHVRQVWEKRTPETYQVWKDVLQDTSITVMSSESLPVARKAVSTQVSDEPRLVTGTLETGPVLTPRNSTTATLVKLAWAITLSKLFTPGQDGNGLGDVVFGQVVHGRVLGIPHEDRIIGPCLNIIPTMAVQNLGLGEITRNCTTWESGTRFGSFIRFQNFTNSQESTCDFDGHASLGALNSSSNKPARLYINCSAIMTSPSFRVAILANFILDDTGGRPMIDRITQLIRQSKPDAEINVYAAIEGDKLPDPETKDLIILTGGPFNLLKDERPKWVVDTLEYLKTVTAGPSKPKILGICWGQQAIALALGGALGKSDRGQIVGIADIPLTPEGTKFFESPSLTIHKNHEILVTDIGPYLLPLALNNEVLMSKDGQVLTFQGHPEMDSVLSRLFVTSDNPVLVGAGSDSGLKPIDSPHDGEIIFERIVRWASPETAHS